MRIHFHVARIQHDAGAGNAIAEWVFVRPDDSGSDVTLEHAFARERAEVGALERSAYERAYGTGDAPLHRQSGGGGQATHPVEVRMSRAGRIAIERRGIALAVVPQAIRARNAERQAKTPAFPIRGRLCVEDY